VYPYMCNSNTLTFRDTRQASSNACSCPTGWRRRTGCLILRGHFQQKSSLITDSFAERDPQPKASYASSPICTPNVWSDILRQYVICLQKKKPVICLYVQLYKCVCIYMCIHADLQKNEIGVEQRLLLSYTKCLIRRCIVFSAKQKQSQQLCFSQ